jgi:glutathionylspermidine synthase
VESFLLVVLERCAWSAMRRTMTTMDYTQPSPWVQAVSRADPLRVPSLARELTHKYMIWDGYVAGARRVDVHPLILPSPLHEVARRAAEDVTRAVRRVAERAFVDAEERRRYGLHPDIERLAAASHTAKDDASLVRVDLLLGEDGDVHACEINADCPGGHNEALALPRLARAAGFMAGMNPTIVVEALASRLEELADGGRVALVFATAYAEDLQVCALLRRELARRGVRAVLAPPTAPTRVGSEVRVDRAPVRVLYRYFPTEYMQGQKNLPGLAEAIERGELRTLTSFAHMYEQSKYAFARAWHAAARETVSDDDARAIRRHVPPTFDLREVEGCDLARREEWVVKRAYGRVGDEVFVGPLVQAGAWGPLVDSVRRRCDAGESWIAQRFVRQRTVSSPWGQRYVTLGAYVLGGSFVGYFARLTPESHVSHHALCVPVFHLGRTGT